MFEVYGCIDQHYHLNNYSKQLLYNIRDSTDEVTALETHEVYMYMELVFSCT